MRGGAANQQRQPSESKMMSCETKVFMHSVVVSARNNSRPNTFARRQPVACETMAAGHAAAAGKPPPPTIAQARALTANRLASKAAVAASAETNSAEQPARSALATMQNPALPATGSAPQPALCLLKPASCQPRLQDVTLTHSRTLKLPRPCISRLATCSTRECT